MLRILSIINQKKKKKKSVGLQVCFFFLACEFFSLGEPVHADILETNMWGSGDSKFSVDESVNGCVTKTKGDTLFVLVKAI